MVSLRATHSHGGTRLRRRISSEEGFGLIEVIVAMVLLVIGVLSAFIAYEASQRADLRGERNAAVAHHAQSEIERIQAMSYGSVGMKTIPTNSGSGKPKHLLNHLFKANPTYQYQWSVS